MTTVLTADRVLVGAAVPDQGAAIDLVGGLLVDAGLVTAEYVGGMHEREAIVSTFLGNGIALPHGTNEVRGAILGTGLAVVQLPAGVAWGEDTARVVIGLAAAGDDHIEMLSRLAVVLEDEALCDRLATLDDPAAILQILMAEPDADRDDGPMPPGIRRTAVITNPHGLHARPAAQVVAGLRGLDAEVTVAIDGRQADARSITALLGLGATEGDTVTVIAHGPDEDAALEAVLRIIQSRRDR